jgi:hypothetical protein
MARDGPSFLEGSEAEEGKKGQYQAMDGLNRPLTPTESAACALQKENSDGSLALSCASSASALPPSLPYLVSAASSSLLSPARSRMWLLCPVLSLLAVVSLLLVTGGTLLALFHSRLTDLMAWLQARAPLSALYYAAFTVLWVLLCLPSTLIELCGGFIFGTCSLRFSSIPLPSFPPSYSLSFFPSLSFLYPHCFFLSPPSSPPCDRLLALGSVRKRSP